jgi:hypothetical protein
MGRCFWAKADQAKSFLAALVLFGSHFSKCCFRTIQALPSFISSKPRVLALQHFLVSSYSLLKLGGIGLPLAELVERVGKLPLSVAPFEEVLLPAGAPSRIPGTRQQPPQVKLDVIGLASVELAERDRDEGNN